MYKNTRLILTAVLCLCIGLANAQTDIDGLMMAKNNLCIGPVYSHSSWDHYWEGTLKRDNPNMGTVSTTMFSVMANYGITNKLNVLANVPYVKTNSSAGILLGMKGFQDASAFLKYEAYSKKIKNGFFTAYAIAGASMPVSNYEPDFLPLSIGLQTKNAYLRALLDVEKGKFFATASGTYVFRSNINLDRTSYYTTSLHYTSEVQMPDMETFNIRMGYRHKDNILEVVMDKMVTLGGFDISPNNIPFPSNRMNATTLGANFKYSPSFANGLSAVGGVFTTLDGRNVGQSQGFRAGLFYIFNFSPKTRHAHNENK